MFAGPLIGTLLRGVWTLLTSRIGLAVILCGLLWAFHIHDKRQAVDAARDGFVTAFELAATEAELDAMRRRLLTATVANQSLQEKVQATEGDALRFAAELEAFKRDTDINPQCRVDDTVLRRLRAN
ncbi:hypothetical protein FHS89_001768 [Rubricella aquisinus]|uniref:Uncharacterized protein n=1 Tax=Rubricella aquisinus TaxID=2028108 RepID=A0A840WKX7_9RHOB|nr:hypothetical protein [Rubricella aquisinus]MBB5515748.1 hypothetical protein [Rubricella aquisinus]